MPASSPPKPEGRAASWSTDDDRGRRDGVDDLAPLSIVLEEGTLLAQKYRLERPAGFGGMAQLWVAKNEATGAEVCIKILVPEKSDDESVERFRREAYAAARLNHRAIVRIFDLVELAADGEATKTKPAALAIVMELLHGETLGDRLMKRGKLPLDEAIDLALPFLSALAHAHKAGVVHRDLKPDNIFLSTDPDGHVIPKVLDFGVSKVAITGDHALGTFKAPTAAPLTLEGVMLGTPSFMSPEQAKGARDVDARSDVFSAGILIYMMLAGKNPFEAENFHSVIAAVLQREVPPLPGVPEPIWKVIEKSLLKDAKARYADATELGIALRRAAGRSSTTDSGVHTDVELPPSVRSLATPLGGDSHVSVPPVDTAESDDGSSSPPPRVATPAARRRAIRIVVGVLAASVVMMIIALLRGPTGSTVPPASTTGATTDPVSATTTTAPAATNATPATNATAAVAPADDTAAAAATSTAAPSAIVPSNTLAADGAVAPAPAPAPAPKGTAAAGTAGTTGAAGATGTVAAAPATPTAVATVYEPTAAIPPPTTTASATAKKRAVAAPTSTGIKEPSIVRDPGF